MRQSRAGRRVNRTLAFPARIARLVESEAEREKKSFNAVVVEILEKRLQARDSGFSAFAREHVRRMQAEPGYHRPEPAEPFDRDELHER